ncbi:MAG: hypothetical protein H8E37_07495 [Planctomycetes bacterium]|nr:hypothetical protein [Planctomycetota bacterium]
MSVSHEQSRKGLSPFGAVLRKELVETSPVTVIVGLFLLTGLAIEVLNDQPRLFFSFVPPEAMMILLASTAICAGLLGLVQTIRESFEGTWAYYLHRPGNRRQLLTMKLLAGASGYLMLCGAFLIGHILIGLLRHSETHPMQWWLVDVILQFSVAGLIVYLGGFLAGIRQARWYVSRLFPLATAVLIWLLVLYIPNWWLLGLPCVAIVSAALLHCIFQTADQRDFA